MALSIKDAETDRLVRRYAALRRTSFTDAIRLAVGDAIRREGHAIEDDVAERRRLEFIARVRKLQAEVAAAPALDDRNHAEILYDEDGLPK